LLFGHTAFIKLIFSFQAIIMSGKQDSKCNANLKITQVSALAVGELDKLFLCCIHCLGMYASHIKKRTI